MAIALALLLVFLSGCHPPGLTSHEAAEARKTIRDASLTAEIQSKLTGDRHSNFARVGVTADRGVVDLNGAVPSVRQKQRAEALAREVEGVTEVRNHLSVQE